MVFSRFRHFPPEIRMCSQKEALGEEAEERIFFLHRRSFRILPTKNNISTFFTVSVEARCAARLFYNICIPVLQLRGWWPRDLMPPDEWRAEVCTVRWGSGIGPRGQSWTESERYWYHHALTRFGEAAEDVLRLVTDDMCSPLGCLYLNTETDRFLLSHEAYTRDKAELIDYYGDRVGDSLLVEDPHVDVCAYQLTLCSRAEFMGLSLGKYEVPRRCMSSRLPQHAIDKLRNVVFCDVKDDTYEGLGTPERLFGSTLGELWGPEGDHGQSESKSKSTTLGELANRSGQPAGEDEIDEHWSGWFFPANFQQPRTLLYLEIPASRSYTLVGEVEERPAKCLDIVELKIGQPKDDDKTTIAGSGNIATKHTLFRQEED